jgi:Protein of unknown function (DUF3626)
VDAGPAMLLARTPRPGPLTINFHPDRLLADGRSVARALRDEGVYPSQFETRISNGGLTAYPGGDRDRWEETLFAGAYQAVGVAPAEPARSWRRCSSTSRPGRVRSAGAASASASSWPV